MINKAIIVGYVGRDPEHRSTNNGTSVCNFSMATTRKYNDNEETTWHNVVAWGKLADICSEYLTKGQLVYVEGRIQVRDYEDRDGNPRKAFEIVADQMRMLGGGNGGGGNRQPNNRQQDNRQQNGGGNRQPNKRQQDSGSFDYGDGSRTRRRAAAAESRTMTSRSKARVDRIIAERKATGNWSYQMAVIDEVEWVVGTDPANPEAFHAIRVIEPEAETRPAHVRRAALPKQKEWGGGYRNQGEVPGEVVRQHQLEGPAPQQSLFDAGGGSPVRGADDGIDAPGKRRHTRPAGRSGRGRAAA